MCKSNLILFVVLGVVFWFTAALVIRFCGAAVFAHPDWKLGCVFALGVPITLTSLFISKQISRLPYTDLLRPVVVMTLTATLLDGVALAWFRRLYSESVDVALHGAAWILWGVGLGLLIAFYLDQKAVR